MSAFAGLLYDGDDTPPARQETALKIAILTSSLPPYPVGGAEHQAWQTARRLAERGHRVTVLARKMLPDTPRVEERDGVRWVRVPYASFPGLSFPTHVLNFLSAWKREPAPDVILAYQMVISGVLGARVARQGPPLVSWVRSEREVRLSEGGKIRLLSPLVLARSRRVLVQAETIRSLVLRELETTGRSELARELAPRIEVLPNAIEVGPEPTYGERAGLVYLGRLLPVKGADVLVEALRLLPSSPPLRILGDGPLRGSLERAARGLPVTFEGRVPLAEVAGRLARARLLVAPSRSEGFPNAILEGMERGVPAVASDVGGIHDVVRDGETGYLAPPGDPAALAERIGRVLEDESGWERMARAARREAKRYGWSSHLDRLEAILAEVAS